MSDFGIKKNNTFPFQTHLLLLFSLPPKHHLHVRSSFSALSFRSLQTSNLHPKIQIKKRKKKSSSALPLSFLFFLSSPPTAEKGKRKYEAFIFLYNVTIKGEIYIKFKINRGTISSFLFFFCFFKCTQKIGFQVAATAPHHRRRHHYGHRGTATEGSRVGLARFNRGGP